MKRIEYSDKIKAIELMGMNEMAENKEIPELTLPRRYSHGSSMMHIPSSSQILERLYNDQGVRVRMVRRGRPNRIPTVKELIDHISKKHERLLELEMKGNKLEKPMDISLTGRRDVRFDSLRYMSDTVRTEVDELDRVRYRCLSERPARFEVWEPEERGSLEITGHQGKWRSSSTPTVPYSTADILYGNEVNGSRGQPNEDARQNSFGELEKSRELARSRSKELEQNPNNRRPSSKSGKQRSLTIDSVAPFDKDREDPLRSLSSSLPPAKPSHHFRPNGIRTNIMKPDQLYSTKTNGAAPGRDQDDLVAMGTLWSPNNNSGQPPPVGSSVVSPQQQQQQHSSNRINSVSNSNTNSFPSKVVSSSSSVNHSMSSSNNTLNTQRKYPGNNIRPIQVQNNVSGRKNNNSTKEQEDPKYTDPMIGAPASFQQRIIELGALEGDTVRWERSKRLKKKKQDRDS